MSSFRKSTWFRTPVEVLFEFHEDPKALERLTPPHQKIEVLERTNGIQEGSRVVIRSHVGPFPVEWHALHTVYIKDRLFVDEQESGPFRKWVHRHEFESENGGSRLTDWITYEMKGGALAEFFGGWIVQWQLKKMFAWRHAVTKLFCEKP